MGRVLAGSLAKGSSSSSAAGRGWAGSHCLPGASQGSHGSVPSPDQPSVKPPAHFSPQDLGDIPEDQGLDISSDLHWEALGNEAMECEVQPGRQ